MKILVTNDDGIDSEGLAVVVQWAVRHGDVWVSAPKTQQSGKSHAITIHSPFTAAQHPLGLGEVTAYAVDSSPADCVRFATLGLKQDFDLIISGVNKGFNLGQDVLYSGTVAAIFESALRSTCGMAISTEYTTFQYAREQLENIYRFFETNRLFDKNVIYNVNVPLQPKGIVVTRQGGAYFSDDWAMVEYGQWIQKGYCVHENKHDLTLDTDATIDGYVTVTPLTVDRSDTKIWQKLSSLKESF